MQTQKAYPGSFCVVTPNFNMSGYLKETIESVLSNLGPNDRYYVIDGGSTDDSVRVLESYAGRLSGFTSEHDRGYAHAVDKGFAMANTEYQYWLACGDLMLPGALDQARSILTQTGSDMIFGDDFYINDSSRVLGFSRGACSDLRGAMIYGDWTPLQDACFWRSDLYKRVGGLDISLRNAADYDLFARFSLAGSTRYIPTAFSAFRRHDGQRSIAHRSAYQSEKESVRRRLVAESPELGITKVLNRVRHYLSVRWRARVQHRIWDLPALHGRRVTDLPCGQYWPAGLDPQSTMQTGSLGSDRQ